jgi:hypothetical protein
LVILDQWLEFMFFQLSQNNPYRRFDSRLFELQCFPSRQIKFFTLVLQSAWKLRRAVAAGAESLAEGQEELEEEPKWWEAVPLASEEEG